MSQDPNTPQTASDEPAQTPPPKRKRRIWLRIVLVLVILVVALVALGPTIASMGFVRSIVLGKVNENLNGHVEIDGWSLGWFSPISASGIKVYDEQKVLVLDIKQVKLGISLMGAIRSNFALGDDNVVDVNSFLVHVDEKGATNLQRLPKVRTSPAAPAPKAEPIKLPDISGKFTVNFAGKIESNASPKPVIVDPSTAVVTIADINQPINSLVKLNFRVGEDGKVSSIETSGNIGAVKQNILDVTMLAAGQKINFSDVNLAALDPFLKSLGADTQLTGTIGGGIEVKTEGLSGLSANGQIVVHGLVFGGGPLGQDQFKSQEIAIPVNITRTAIAGGGSIIKFENVGLKMDQATVNVTGQVTEAALINLTQNKGPGSDGSITISADIPNIATIANQLKHTLHLIEGVELTSGAIHQQLTIAFARDRINVSQNLTADAKGKRDGKDIQLQPITFNGSASAIPNGKPLPDFRDLKIALQTVFATVNGGGETLAKTNINGNFDLNKLVAEVSQFSDMGGLTLQGTGSFALNTAGDPTNTSAPIEIQAQASIQNLMLASSSGEKKFDVESKSFDASASVSSSAGKISFTKPATLAITGLTVNSDKQAILSNDGLRASINGNLTMKDGIAAEFSDVSLDTDSKLVTVSKSGNGPLSFSAVKTGNTTAIRGNGALSIAANMAKLANLAQSFSGSPVAGQPKLTNGQLTGTVTLARTDQTAIDFNGQLAGLTIVANGNNVINNEQMTLTLSAKAPDDPNQPLTATGKIGSSFFTTTLSDVKVAMTGAMLDMLQSATIDAQVPDAPKFYALANSLSPMPATPASPGTTAEPQAALELTSGSASLHLNVTRDAASKSTNINLTDATVKNLAIRRGKQTYAFDKSTPITLKLASSIKGTDKIDSIQVKELSGDVRVATLSMPEPINITDLQAKQPNLQGSIALKGKIEDVTPILAVVQGADAMPYAGQYALSEKLSTVGNATKLAGSIDVNDFKVLAENKRDAAFTEPQIAIRNDLNLDLDQKKIAITTLTLDMPKSQAVKLSMTGGVNFWGDRRQIRDGTKLDVTYDLAKLWTIAYPTLSPEQQASYKDLKIAGKYTKTFTLFGAFPAAPTLAQSIKSLNAEGGLTIDLLDTMGLKIEKFSPQVKMVRGVVTLAGAPAVTNGGSLAFDGIVVDMTQVEPTLSIPKNKKLLQGVKLDTALAATLGKMGAIVFTNASTADGALSFTVVNCDRLPLGQFTQQNKNYNASFILAVDDLLLDGPVLKVIAAAADLGTGGIQGRIPPSTLKLSNGMADTNLSLEIAKSGRDSRTGQTVLKGIPIVFAGGVNLTNLDLKNFTVNIPADLMVGDLRKIAPNGAVLPLKGNAAKPNLDLAAFIRDNAVKGLLGGGNGNGDNPVGDLLKGLGGGGNDSQQNPPRRPRQQGQ